jgi:glycosyltransferase involved in cell wall biosynthesis
MIICNVRTLAANLTGVQRYTSELLQRFGSEVETIAPSRPRQGFSGHAWEQFVLPKRIGSKLLWCPGNSGPISVERQVVSIMDVSPLDHPSWSSYQFSQWYKFLIPRLVRRVRAVLTLSEYSKARIINWCPGSEGKVHAVHLAADGRFRPVDAEAASHAARRLSIPASHYVLALGSLEPRKNLRRLLQAWEVIQPKLPEDVWLVLAGAKGAKQVFGEQSFEHLPPRVHLTGHVPDQVLPALYSGAIASVYLSLYEGFGLPPLEAMACGTPVLTSSVTSLPEVVGDAAVTVDPYDIEAIAAAIYRLVDDPGLRSDLRARGLLRATRFSWDRTAQETLRILKEAAVS